LSAGYGGSGEALTYTAAADFAFTTTASEEFYLMLLDNNYAGTRFGLGSCANCCLGQRPKPGPARRIHGPCADAPGNAKTTHANVPELTSAGLP
jgi:hypothetical protein